MAVRTYYKHKRVEDVKIPYNFKCENCMKNSGELQAHLVGMEAEYNSNFKKLKEDKVKKLEKQAHDNLVAKVKEAYKDAEEKGIYCTEFKDECPYCHKAQSWAVSGLIKKRIDTPIVIFLVGVILFIVALIGHYFATNADVPLPIAFGILGVSFVCSIIVFVWNTIKINLKIKATASTGAKNTPNIDWKKVQNLLDE